MARVIGTILIAWWVTAAGGCGPSANETVPVRGRVMADGHPLVGGLIVFTPDPERGESGPLSRAVIDENGEYELHCTDGPGAIPGWHRITIAAPPVPDDPSQFQQPVSRKYAHPEHSGLSREVRPDGENVFNFQLD